MSTRFRGKVRLRQAALICYEAVAEDALRLCDNPRTAPPHPCREAEREDVVASRGRESSANRYLVRSAVRPADAAQRPDPRFRYSPDIRGHS
jgi:hypothetical protein